MFDGQLSKIGVFARRHLREDHLDDDQGRPQ
jgi:hypothetical protein